MKRIKRTLLLALMLGCALFLLCGCNLNIPITIRQSGLPDGYELHMLLKLDNEENKELNESFSYTDEPYYRPYSDAVTSDNSSGDSENTAEEYDSEIYNYSENGWKCADIYLQYLCILEDYTDYGTTDFCLESNAERSRLAKGYKTFKLAVCSEDGDMYKLSNEVVMQYEDKCGFYTEYSYDYESNTLTPTGGIVYFTDKNNATPEDYISLLGILWYLSCILFVLLLIIMFIVRLTGRNHRSRGFVITACVLNAPSVFMLIYESVLLFVPYYDISGATIWEKLWILANAEALILLPALLFGPVFLLKPKLPKNPKPKEPFTPETAVFWIVFSILFVLIIISTVGASV